MYKLHCSSIFESRLHLFACTKLASYSTPNINVECVPRKIKQLEKSYAKFSKCYSKSLLKKHLTKSLFDRLIKKKTSFNSTLLDCVQSGFCNLDSVIGVYAPDAEAYTVFADLFNPIIEDIHEGFNKDCVHPKEYFGDLNYFTNVDPHYKYVVSTKIRCIRSLANYAFNPNLQINQYNDLQNIIAKCLCGLEKDLKGNYYSLSSMGRNYKKILRSSNLLFKEGNKFLRSANALKGWPLGRGIYFNGKKTFVIWVNEEDHIRIISKQEGGDFNSVYSRLVKAVNIISARLNFARHSRLGFLTTSPANIGNLQTLF